MSVFKCEDFNRHATEVRDAVVVNIYSNSSSNYSELWCPECMSRASEYSKYQDHDRFEALHEPTPGSEMSISIECWLHQLIRYTQLMPQLLEQKARAA